ncbi:hypothetical protein F2Q70_00013491 [Brassica cretica]|uniref:Uncharacterized protein n=1 Tax=Brassica cretica TaxID=69181 RepID=A0A8S9M1H0_BRACR|nr:hypothetical protein F2Q70_00013491 [Brassica cretica]
MTKRDHLRLIHRGEIIFEDGSGGEITEAESERSRRRSRRDHGGVEERSRREITRRRGEITEASREITEASRREITEASRKYHGGVERDHNWRAPSILDFVERENTKAESSREHKRRFGFLSEREREAEKPWCNTCLIRCASSEAKLSAVSSIITSYFFLLNTKFFKHPVKHPG